MANYTQRLERYYNALIEHSRRGDLPSIQEARRDLHRDAERQLPFTSP